MKGRNSGKNSNSLDKLISQARDLCDEDTVESYYSAYLKSFEAMKLVADSNDNEYELYCQLINLKCQLNINVIDLEQATQKLSEIENKYNTIKNTTKLSFEHDIKATRETIQDFSKNSVFYHYNYANFIYETLYPYTPADPEYNPKRKKFADSLFDIGTIQKQIAIAEKGIIEISKSITLIENNSSNSNNNANQTHFYQISSWLHEIIADLKFDLAEVGVNNQDTKISLLKEAESNYQSAINKLNIINISAPADLDASLAHMRELLMKEEGSVIEFEPITISDDSEIIVDSTNVISSSNNHISSLQSNKTETTISPTLPKNHNSDSDTEDELEPRSKKQKFITTSNINDADKQTDTLSTSTAEYAEETEINAPIQSPIAAFSDNEDIQVYHTPMSLIVTEDASPISQFSAEAPGEENSNVAQQASYPIYTINPIEAISTNSNQNTTSVTSQSKTSSLGNQNSDLRSSLNEWETLSHAVRKKQRRGRQPDHKYFTNTVNDYLAAQSQISAQTSSISSNQNSNSANSTSTYQSVPVQANTISPSQITEVEEVVATGSIPPLLVQQSSTTTIQQNLSIIPFNSNSNVANVGQPVISSTSAPSVAVNKNMNTAPIDKAWLSESIAQWKSQTMFAEAVSRTIDIRVLSTTIKDTSNTNNRP